MHEIDIELINLVERKLKKVSNSKLKDLLEEYRLACQLSNGPDLSRSKYWASKARQLNYRLTNLVTHKQELICEGV